MLTACAFLCSIICNGRKNAAEMNSIYDLQWQKNGGDSGTRFAVLAQPGLQSRETRGGRINGMDEIYDHNDGGGMRPGVLHAERSGDHEP